MIKIDDIIKRSRYINLSNKKQEYDKYHTRSKLLLESNIYRFDDKKFLLQHWESLDENQVECFKKCIDILDEAYENDNIKDFNYVKSYIINEVAPTVRDAKQTAKYLKYKTTRMKNKIKEKIEKNIEDIKDTAGKVVNKTKETNKQAANTIKTNVKKSLGKEDIHEAYVQILDTMIKYDHCDRVLENNYSIQKRFNIMNMVEKTDINYNPALLALVDSICECVNTYDADFSTRLNTTLETCFYFLSRKDKDFNKPLVLEEVVNNFISGNLSDNNLLEMKSVIESSVVFNNEDKCNVEFIYTSTPYEESTYNDEKISLDNTENKITNVIESNYFIMDFDPLNEVSVSPATKTAKDIVNDFKLSKTKRPADVRTCVSKMFTKSADQIIDGTPNFLSWVRLTYIIGATSVHPVLGGVVLLTDQFIAMKLKRRDISKMITVFKNERQNVAEKIKKVDERDKRNLKEYDKYLKNGLEKLIEYKESLLSSYEIYSKDFGEDYDREKEFAFLRDEEDDTDMDFDYSLEATSFEKLFEKSNNFSKDYFTDNIKKCINIMNEDTIDIVTDVACKYPCIISTNRLYNILKEELDEVKDNTSGPKRWVRMSCLSSNMRKLDHESAEYVVTSDDADENVFTVISGLEDLFTEYSISKSLTATNESMSTMVKTITNKLRKAMQKAADTDKELSRKVDSSVNMFLTGMQRAARNENREAIIRGSILPSASKVIKAAIMDAGVALINPALAIILALGQFAARKKMQKKERQLVLDEIDIELEMCKRYLRQAEDQNDLEAQKKILQIQRNLERQKQRIQYNMKLHWNQDVPDINKSDYD